MTTQVDERVERAAATSARFRAAIEGRDLEGFMATLAPDVTLRSPITGRFAFRGHDQLRNLMAVVFQELEDVHYSDDVGDADTRALRWSARIGRQELHEATFLRLDDEARVREIELFVRPLPGLVAMMAAFGPGLAARHSARRGRLVRALIAPMVAFTRIGDRLSGRLVPIDPP